MSWMRRLTRKRPRRRAFSLLEIIVAMGVLAVGASAAFALLVAAAAAGRRAEHQVNAALIAETILNDMNGFLVEGLELEDFEAADSESETRYLERDASWSAYPDYVYDLAITPLPGPDPNETWHYLVEVDVRWAEKGRARSAHFATVMLKNLSHLDNPMPRQRR